jgi:L-alanine-DL-glutamate epimerase-like enolase superfamily enzyme
MKRVAAVRDMLGPNKDLMVDCNCTWDYVRAIKTIPYLEELNVKFIEEPAPIDHLETSAKIASATWIPIAGYENETHILGFQDWMLKGGVYYIQPNACRVGGVTAMRKIFTLASVYERAVCTHSWSTAICMLANLHLMATIANGEYLEYDVNPNPFRDELNVYPFELKDGYVLLPERPGLGIELNMDIINKYKMTV